jgi:hypothetical protein
MENVVARYWRVMLGEFYRRRFVSTRLAATLLVDEDREFQRDFAATSSAGFRSIVSSWVTFVSGFPVPALNDVVLPYKSHSRAVPSNWRTHERNCWRLPDNTALFLRA